MQHNATIQMGSYEYQLHILSLESATLDADICSGAGQQILPCHSQCAPKNGWDKAAMGFLQSQASKKAVQSLTWWPNTVPLNSVCSSHWSHCLKIGVFHTEKVRRYSLHGLPFNSLTVSLFLKFGSLARAQQMQNSPEVIWNSVSTRVSHLGHHS